MSKSRVGAPVAPLPKVAFPKTGKSKEEVQGILDQQYDRDVKIQRGRMWGNVYFADDDVYEVATSAYTQFMVSNPINNKAFPSFFKFEAEVLGGIADLYGGDGAAGNITSGGTESNLMAMKTAREKAAKERPEIKTPEIVVPVTGHSSFSKAAQLFGLKCVRVEVDDHYKATLSAMEQAVNENTIAMIGSAPGSPHGVVDPIPELASFAKERDIHFHVDGCLGGFVVPFLKKLGHKLPDFDFRVPGVTSISVDPHKFGWSTKPCSCILYRDFETYKHQPIEISDWAGGIHMTPTIQGSRAGGAVASMWAVMNFLGEEGFIKRVEKMMRVTMELARGINQIAGLRMTTEPETNNCCFMAENAETIDIMAVAEGLEERGWYGMSRNQIPPSIVLKVQPVHEAVVQTFLDDLKELTRRVENEGAKMKEEITY